MLTYKNYVNVSKIWTAKESKPAFVAQPTTGIADFLKT
jgi:hypothetical protein